MHNDKLIAAWGRTLIGRSEADRSGSVQQLGDAYRSLVKAEALLRKNGLDGTWSTNGAWFPAWERLVEKGQEVAKDVLSTRSIPDNGKDRLELTYRLLFGSTRPPRDFLLWWDDNANHIRLLFEASRWPAKTDGTDELFTVGSFTVHNTVGATGPELKGIKDELERAGKAIKSNPVPGFARVLYGDVHVVGNIREARNAAWYDITDDSLYLRLKQATGMDEVHALIHELGHRYWHRFAEPAKKKAWEALHNKLKRRPAQLPGVGEEVHVDVEGAGGRWPIVTQVTPNNLYYTIDIDGRTYKDGISTAVMSRYYKAVQRSSVFPTRYSATNAQEHFCESVALMATGTLTDEFAVPFNAVWNP